MPEELGQYLGVQPLCGGNSFYLLYNDSIGSSRTIKTPAHIEAMAIKDIQLLKDSIKELETGNTLHLILPHDIESSLTIIVNALMARVTYGKSTGATYDWSSPEFGHFGRLIRACSQPGVSKTTRHYVLRKGSDLIL